MKRENSGESAIVGRKAKSVNAVFFIIIIDVTLSKIIQQLKKWIK